MAYKIYVFLSTTVNEMLLVLAGILIVIRRSDALHEAGILILTTGSLRAIQFMVQLAHYIPLEDLPPSVRVRTGDGSSEQHGMKN